MLHGLQAQTQQFSCLALPPNAAIQRQINQRFPRPWNLSRWLAIEADLAQGAAVAIAGDQQQAVGIGKAGLKPALVIGWGNGLG